MILDQISQMHRYVSTLPALQQVLEILESGKLATLPLGSYTTDKPNLRYNLFTYKTEKQEASEYEVHRKEADVQILLKGFERMDIASTASFTPTTVYDPTKDFLMGKGEKQTSYHAKEGSFVVFFPGEGHAPNLVDEKSCDVLKVVFKILM
ncbi:YhcH/YjgK/YiaL family protein [Sphaerochaeta sp. PS]|uniref:YhcH/YjgK/YiaL family protein n=1 Tax=Sphaerochaeta sp. PS TaxID=3076336 RepID=UPI0028A2FC2E|nr:YhcH/YjgK/YiaL family protein [Sphaerochaeta sp. PS]MDT4761083.1 YhcH/YjgK/YiaL family protein [Sphaerochaeta sp. PS]